MLRPVIQHSFLLSSGLPLLVNTRRERQLINQVPFLLHQTIRGRSRENPYVYLVTRPSYPADQADDYICRDCHEATGKNTTSELRPLLTFLTSLPFRKVRVDSSLCHFLFYTLLHILLLRRTCSAIHRAVDHVIDWTRHWWLLLQAACLCALVQCPSTRLAHISI